MIDKDPSTYGFLTYAWVIGISIWGGIVNFCRLNKDGKARPFDLRIFLGELVTSAFAGILTFYLCEASGISHVLTAAFVGISGHMGSKLIDAFENYANNKIKDMFQKPTNPEDKDTAK